jgi:hypothetical protein
MKILDGLSQGIVALIKKGDKGKINQIFKQFNVKNVSTLKNASENEEHFLQIKGKTAAAMLKQSRTRHDANDLQQLHLYDTSLWNPVLFAVYFQKVDIVSMLLQDYS